MVSPCGLGVMNMVAEIDGRVTSWRRTVVTLVTMRFNGQKNWSWWGEERESLSVQHSMFVITIERSLAEASVDPGRTSLLDSEDLKVRSTDQERIHDQWLLHIDFSRTLTAQENFYVYCFHLASRKELMLQGRRELRHEAKSTEISKRPLWGKGRLIKEFHNFLYERWLQVGTSKQSCSHLYLLRKFGVLTTHCF
jgi:hypothetical protein